MSASRCSLLCRIYQFDKNLICQFLLFFPKFGVFLFRKSLPAASVWKWCPHNVFLVISEYGVLHFGLWSVFSFHIYLSSNHLCVHMYIWLIIGYWQVDVAKETPLSCWGWKLFSVYSSKGVQQKQNKTKQKHKKQDSGLTHRLSTFLACSSAQETSWAPRNKEITVINRIGPSNPTSSGCRSGGSEKNTVKTGLRVIYQIV